MRFNSVLSIASTLTQAYFVRKHVYDYLRLFMANNEQQINFWATAIMIVKIQ